MTPPMTPEQELIARLTHMYDVLLRADQTLYQNTIPTSPGPSQIYKDAMTVRDSRDAITRLRDEVARLRGKEERGADPPGCAPDDDDRAWANATAEMLFGKDGRGDGNDLAAVAQRAMARALAAEARVERLEGALTELVDDLNRRAEHCKRLVNSSQTGETPARLIGKRSAYEHSAELAATTLKDTRE